jgi:uncharacterized protein
MPSALVLSDSSPVASNSPALETVPPAEGMDRKVTIVAVTAAVALTLLQYCKSEETWREVRHGLHTLAGWCGLDEMQAQLTGNVTTIGPLAWWAVCCVICYFGLPALVIKFLFREQLTDYGLKLRGAGVGLLLYLGMLAVVLPLVALVSGHERFQQTYPFYPLSPGDALGPAFFCWELLYAAQFVALEFFFRGFMVMGTRHRLGLNAVAFMMIPYCMIHFQKPMLETFAAIIAGFVLGIMSYRTRSVWMGAVLHITVAWTMDFVVLWRRGIIDF